MKYNDIKIITNETSGSEPVSLAEAKEHLRITFTDDDTYITNLIKACRQELEGIRNKSYVAHSILCEVFNPLGNVELLYGAGSDSIGSVVDENGNDVAYTYRYGVFTTPFNYGLVEYETEANVSPEVKQKIMEMVAHKYSNRGDMDKPKAGGIWLA